MSLLLSLLLKLHINSTSARIFLTTLSPYFSPFFDSSNRKLLTLFVSPGLQHVNLKFLISHILIIIIINVLIKLDLFYHSVQIRLAATNALLNSLEFLKQNFEREVLIIGVYCYFEILIPCSLIYLLIFIIY